MKKNNGIVVLKEPSHLTCNNVSPCYQFGWMGAGACPSIAKRKPGLLSESVYFLIRCELTEKKGQYPIHGCLLASRFWVTKEWGLVACAL